jgi:hypothetical protein
MRQYVHFRAVVVEIDSYVVWVFAVAKTKLVRVYSDWEGPPSCKTQVCGGLLRGCRRWRVLFFQFKERKTCQVPQSKE